jgi:hypothetical protein
VPASVIGPVRGPRSASTSPSDRVAGRRPAMPGCDPRIKGELAGVSLRRGLAMSRSYRSPFSNLRCRTLVRTGSEDMAGRRSDRARARGGGRGGLRPFASAHLRASVLRQSGAPTLLPGADYLVKGPARRSAMRPASRTRSRDSDGQDRLLEGSRPNRPHRACGRSPPPAPRPTISAGLHSTRA